MVGSFRTCVQVRARSQRRFQIIFGIRQYGCYQTVTLIAAHSDKSSFTAYRPRVIMVVVSDSDLRSLSRQLRSLLGGLVRNNEVLFKD